MDRIVIGTRASQAPFGDRGAIEIAVPFNPLLHPLEFLNLR
jgi:hypothetical protein